MMYKAMHETSLVSILITSTQFAQCHSVKLPSAIVHAVKWQETVERAKDA